MIQELTQDDLTFSVDWYCSEKGILRGVFWTIRPPESGCRWWRNSWIWVWIHQLLRRGPGFGKDQQWGFRLHNRYLAIRLILDRL